MLCHLSYRKRVIWIMKMLSKRKGSHQTGPGFSCFQKSPKLKLRWGLYSREEVYKSTSIFLWSTTILRDNESNGSLTVALNYRSRNFETKINNTFCPGVMKCLIESMKLRHFSKMDLKPAFRQFHMKPGDLYKAALNTTNKQYEYIIYSCGFVQCTCDIPEYHK